MRIKEDASTLTQFWEKSNNYELCLHPLKMIMKKVDGFEVCANFVGNHDVAYILPANFAPNLGKSENEQQNLSYLRKCH